MSTRVERNPFFCCGLVPMLLFVALMSSAMVLSGRLEAQAAGQEVGLVTGVSGDVTYENGIGPGRTRECSGVHEDS